MNLRKVINSRTNLVKDEISDLLAFTHSVLNRWTNFFPQLLLCIGSVILGRQKYIQLSH
jgi:hypothetical protein